MPPMWVLHGLSALSRLILNKQQRNTDLQTIFQKTTFPNQMPSERSTGMGLLPSLQSSLARTLPAHSVFNSELVSFLAFAVFSYALNGSDTYFCWAISTTAWSCRMSKREASSRRATLSHCLSRTRSVFESYKVWSIKLIHCLVTHCSARGGAPRFRRGSD